MVMRVNRTGDILAFMSQHTGVVYSPVQVADAIYGKNDEVARKTVPKVLSNLHTAGQLEMPTKGAYVYRGGNSGPKPPTPTMFEYVGTLKNGDQLAKDEDGNLYKFEQI